MARTDAGTSIDDILRSAMEPVLKRASVAIAKAMADMAAAHVDRELRGSVGKAAGRRGQRGGPARAGRGSRRRIDLTRWVADRRARRVPKFVIEMTGGLDTKKKIVAKFGEDAAFEKGKPLPKPK